MSNNVATVLSNTKCIHNPTECCGNALEYINTFVHPECALAALAAENYAVLQLPERVTAARLEEQLADEHHVIQFTNKGWTIAHPLIERLDGSLFECDVVWDWDDPGLRGRYKLVYDEDGVQSLGERVEDTP